MITRLRISRRQTLVGGLALGALATGGVYVGSADARDFFKAMLRSELPGVRISDATIDAFTTDAIKEVRPRFAAKLKALSMSCQIVGYSGIMAVLGDLFYFQHFRRDMLTLFLFSTDFFELPDPRARELTYVGLPGACSNPFAQFGPGR